MMRSGSCLPFTIPALLVLLRISSPSSAQSCSLSVSPSLGSFGTRLSVRLGAACNFSALNVFSIRATYTADSGVTEFLSFTEVGNLDRSNRTVVARLGTSSLTNSSRNASLELYNATSIAAGQLLVKQNDSLVLYPDLRISNVTPTGAQSGAIITIRGCFPPQCGDNGAVNATIAGIAATVLAANQSEIRLQVGRTNQVLTNQPLVLQSTTGASVTSRWSYLPPIIITTVTPSNGQTGTRVFINGSNLIGLINTNTSLNVNGVTVLLGALQLKPVTSASSASSLLVIIPKCTPSNCQSFGHVQVRTSSGADANSTQNWIRHPDGVITSVQPPAAQPGDQIKVCGVQLSGYGTTVTKINLAGIAVSVAEVPYNNCVNISVPVLPNGTLPTNPGPVQFTADTGAVIQSVVGVTFLFAAIQHVSPVQGRQGTRVTITGINLNTTSNVTVLIGGVTTYDMTVASNGTVDKLSVRVGKGSRSSTIVVRYTLNGTLIELVSSQRWSSSPASVINVTPLIGQRGTRVTITGTNFFGPNGHSVTSAALKLSNGSMFTSAFTVTNSDNSTVNLVARELTLTTSVAGQIAIESDSGAMSYTRNWTLMAPGEVKAIEPLYGQYGTKVTLTGRFLTGYAQTVVQVQFGNINASIISGSANAATLAVAIGQPQKAFLQPTPVSVTLTSNSGATVTAGKLQWTYLLEGSVSAVHPSSGELGSIVTLKGTNLLGNGTMMLTIRLPGVKATPLDVNNSYITARLTDLEPSFGRIELISNTGAIVRPNSSLNWTLLQGAAISHVEPLLGQYGTWISVYGNRILGFGGQSIQSVSVGGIPAYAFSINSNHTQLKFRLGNTSKEIRAPVVITSNTNVTIRSIQNITYLKAGAVSTVQPSVGMEGSTVVISGSQLHGAGATAIKHVSLGSITVPTILTDLPSVVVVRAGNSSINTTQLSLTIEGDTGALVTFPAAFQYLISREVISVVPEQGQEGTEVNVSVSGGLDGTERVTLAGVSAQVSSTTNNTLIVRARRPPVQGQFSGDVTMTNSRGEVARRLNAFTYQAAAVLNSISPSFGRCGTVVTVTGRNLLLNGNVTNLTVGGAPADLIAPATNNILKARLRVEPQDLDRDVHLLLNTQATASALDIWRTSPPAKITDIQPPQGQNGTRVIIVGRNLLLLNDNVSEVRLAGIPVSKVVSANSTIVQVIAGSSTHSVTGVVDIQAVSGAMATSSISWTYVQPVKISSIEPPSGQLGTLVTIAGFGLLSGGKSIQHAYLAGQVATVKAASSTVVILEAPAEPEANASRTGIIRLIANTGGDITLANMWTFLPSGQLTRVIPAEGQNGTRVTINGNNLLLTGGNISHVLLGNTSLAITTGNSNTTVQVQVVCEQNGNLPLTVIASSGAKFGNISFTCLKPGLIKQVHPEHGLEGTRVTITGINLLGYGTHLAEVQLAGVAVDISLLSVFDYTNGSITVQAGPSSQAKGDVIIQSNTGATVKLSNAWTYDSEGNVTEIIPQTARPGENVTMYGFGLLAGTSGVLSVEVDGSPSIEVYTASDTTITFRLGSVSTAKRSKRSIASTQIKVITIDGGFLSSTITNFSISHTSECTLTTLFPPAGQEGTSVTITGTGLLTATTVWLDGQRAVLLPDGNDTHLRVRAIQPAEITNKRGYVHVELNSSYICGLPNVWQYYNSSAVAVQPSSGRQGTRVAITAHKLLDSLTQRNVNVTAVHLGEQPAKIIKRESLQTVAWSNLTTAVPFVQVEVGQSSGRTLSPLPATISFSDRAKLVVPNAWMYLPEGRVDKIEPPSGTNGSLVTIYGQSLIGGGSLKSLTLAGANTRIISANESTIQVEVLGNAPSTTAGIVSSLSSTGAVFNTTTDKWTWHHVQLTATQPSFGQTGTNVQLIGTELLAGDKESPDTVGSVTLDGIQAIVQRVNRTSIFVQAGEGRPLGRGDVIVQLATGATYSLQGAFNYTSPARVTLLEPERGSVVYGMNVRITGQNLLGGGHYAQQVCINGVKAQEVSIATDTVVQVQAGLNKPATNSTCSSTGISIQADSGAVLNQSSPLAYSTPNQLAISPPIGQNGTIVTIWQSGMLQYDWSTMPPEYVKLVGVTARVITANATHLQVITGQSLYDVPTTGDVEVRSFSAAQAGLGAIAMAQNAFTYLPTGQIFSLQPSSGQRGTRVMITGRSLLGNATQLQEAKLGNDVVEIETQSDETVTVKIYRHQRPSTVPLVLISKTGARVSLSNAFTFLESSSIAQLQPASGRWGTSVVVHGARLLGGGESISSVTVGNVQATNIQSNNSVVQFQLGRARLTTNQTLNVTLKLEANTGALTVSSMLYLPEAQLFSADPSTGRSKTVFCIIGNNFLGGGKKIVKVMLGNIAATIINGSTSDSEMCLQAGLQPNGTAMPNVTLAMQADTGARLEIPAAWSYEQDCPQTQYRLANASCASCHPQCNGCTGPNDTDCKFCKDLKIETTINGVLTLRCVGDCPLQRNKTCVPSCQSSEYTDVVGNSSFCLPCNSECSGCFGPAPTQCLSCRNVNDSGLCKARCPTEKYNDSTGSCQPCNSQCDQRAGCYGDKPFQCVRCANFQTIDELLVNLTDDLGVLRLINICVAQCPPEHFIDQRTKHCRKCSPLCAGNCTGPLASDCQFCANYSKNGRCVSACREPFYTTVDSSGNNVCHDCHALCAECTNSNRTLGAGCLKCVNLSMTTNGITECVGACTTGYYTNLTLHSCEKCDSSCGGQGCTGPGPQGCKPTASDSSTGMWTAGTGVVAIVAAVVVLLLLIILIIILYQRHQRRSKMFQVSEEQILLKERETETTMSSNVSRRHTNDYDDGKHLLSTSNSTSRASAFIENTGKQDEAEEYTVMQQPSEVQVEGELYEPMASTDPAPAAPAVASTAQPMQGGEDYEVMSTGQPTLPIGDDVYETMDDRGHLANAPIHPPVEKQQIPKRRVRALSSVSQQKEAKPKSEENMLPLPPRSRPHSGVDQVSHPGASGGCGKTNTKTSHQDSVLSTVSQPSTENALPLPPRSDRPAVKPARAVSRSTSAASNISHTSATVKPTTYSKVTAHYPSVDAPNLPPRNPGMRQSTSLAADDTGEDIYEVADKDDDDEGIYEVADNC